MKFFLSLFAAIVFALPSVQANAAKSANLAHSLTEGSDYDKGANEFARLIKEYSEDSLNVRIYPNAQLGMEQVTAKDTQLGLINMALVAINNASIWYPPLDVTMLPFIFRDREHVSAFINGPVGQELFENYRKESGLRIVSVFEWGDRGIMNSKKPIEKPSDLEGIKIRLPKNDVMLDTYIEFGANPTAIDWGELYAALQQGVADGLEGAPPGLIDMKFGDLLDYYSHIPVFHGLAVIVVNDNWFNNLTEKEQEAILKAGREAGDFQRALSAKSHETALSEMQEIGVNVNTLDDLSAFIDASQAVYEKHKDTIGEEWIAKVQGINNN